MSSEQAFDIIDLHGADAVVVDGGRFPSGAVGIAGEMRTTYRGVDVILVLEDTLPNAPKGQRVLRKWSAAASLAQAVEEVRREPEQGVVPPAISAP